MNALALDYHPPRREWVNWPWLRSNGLAAAVALALHGALLGGLMLGWSSLDAPPVQTRTLTTQLLILPPAPEPVPVAAAPVIEPVQPPPPAPASLPITPPVEAAKPQAEPQRQIEQAALARKRVDEQKREREQQQNAQRLREAEQHKQQEQQRLAEQQRQQGEQQRQAEQVRLSAERARQAQQPAQQQAAAADSSQYQPLSKQAPDYPERALDKGIEGDCTVSYDVSPQGTVVNPQVQGACHPLFIRPSLAAAQTFRYQPRIVDGKAVTVSGVKNTFHYRIK
ncbi:TonB family protein [Pseudomonas syringae pv. tagetis]|uniref:Protein TonB n=1 Tax=Pseudomonas syringae pv. tagetis TaxID=129140 RepID=A0A0Q0BH00_9PSED|nr:energy transducer TonB [Pseudomonas syringae group genomosp. 7]KPY88874.1 putative TonB protein [Pseudomonas syringae pv. tagetis]RMW09240.1 putative TonB protein [Pseudomonas syringae pv. tagetis]RMW18842.1 putative TonB protein [Pseudomonas syringae pv. tagetis]UNB66676.1 TonB family protein [Pseudomonas syringae pv. tagetis]